MVDPFVRDFVAETWDHLVRLDSALAALEKEPSRSDLLAGMFRMLHTIKGGCSVLRLHELGRAAHAAESVLEKIRDGSLDVNASALSALMTDIDRVKDLLTGLEATGEESAIESRPLIEPCDEVVVAPLGVSVGAEVPPLIVPEGRNRVADLSIRVNVDALDRLMNLVGELVLTRNQMLQLVRGDETSRFTGPISQLDRVTTDLQQGVMKTRMQPVGQAWSTLPRLVRDLSRIIGKPIELELQGAETELDRTVLEAIQDPLTHLVRNAADHGIERPEVRRAAGKPEAGRLKLDAVYEAGHVVISLEDDGAGIPRRKVIQTALRQKLITDDDAEQLPDAEIIRLLFRPGFSTAEQVTTVSGRGVGLDVVRTAMERVGGSVEMTSEPGRGTKVRLKLPLSMAVISAFVVDSGGQRFAIPQPAVVEIVRRPAEVCRPNSPGDQQAVFRLRDRMLPLIPLREALQLEVSCLGERDGSVVVVVQVGEEQFGLLVDAVSDPQELVVKPVGAHLKHLPVYHGTTILGDGRAILILDVAGVVSQFGGLFSADQPLDSPQDHADSPVETTSLLLFRTAAGDVMAVPVALVSRLEEFPVQRLERSGTRRVVQYHGELLPLLPIAGTESCESSAELQPVILFNDGRQTFGLMVDRIQDIVNEPLVVRLPSQRPGVLGTALIAGKATDLLDTHYYLMQIHPDGFPLPAVKQTPKKVLVIDDSLFFRQLVRTALEADGYRTTVADSAERAMEMLHEGNPFDVILCDIEMPGMNGCEFAAWFREREPNSPVPLVAITSLDKDVHGPRILAAGFDRLLIKFHPQQLRQTLLDVLPTPDVAHRARCA